MSTGYGQVAFGNPLGRRVGTIASGQARYKTGGITLDWNTVGAPLVDTTIQQEGRVIPAGKKFVRFGTVLCKITSATGGLTVGKYGPYNGTNNAGATSAGTTLNGAVVVGQTAVPLASAAGISPGDVLHIAAGGGTAEDLIVGSVNGNTVTFVTAAGFAHNTGTAVTKPGDGRLTMTRGECYILDHTVVFDDLSSDQIGWVYDGCSGQFYASRVASDLASGVPTNPVLATLLSAFPTLSPYEAA